MSCNCTAQLAFAPRSSNYRLLTVCTYFFCPLQEDTVIYWTAWWGHIHSLLIKGSSGVVIAFTTTVFSLLLNVVRRLISDGNRQPCTYVNTKGLSFTLCNHVGATDRRILKQVNVSCDFTARLKNYSPNLLLQRTGRLSRLKLDMLKI